ATGLRHLERALEHDVGDGIEPAHRQVLRPGKEISGGVIDESGKRTAGPDRIEHRLDRLGRLDVAHDRERARPQVRRGFLEHRGTAAAQIDGCAERDTGPRDLLAQATAPAGDKDTGIPQQPLCKHRPSPSPRAWRAGGPKVNALRSTYRILGASTR